MLDNLNSDLFAALSALSPKGSAQRVQYLKNEKFDQIKSLAKHDTESENQFNLYKNQIIPVDDVLNTNTAFKSCFLYQKLDADFTRYIERFKEAQIVSS